jgi:hypothetical protein
MSSGRGASQHQYLRLLKTQVLRPVCVQIQPRDTEKKLGEFVSRTVGLFFRS